MAVPIGVIDQRDLFALFATRSWLLIFRGELPVARLGRARVGDHSTAQMQHGKTCSSTGRYSLPEPEARTRDFPTAWLTSVVDF